MNTLRNSSLDQLDQLNPKWRWHPFLSELIKSCSTLDLEPYPIESEFLEKKTVFLNFFKNNYYSLETLNLPFDGLIHLSNFQSSLGRKNIKKFIDNQVIRNSISEQKE